MYYATLLAVTLGVTFWTGVMVLLAVGSWQSRERHIPAHARPLALVEEQAAEPRPIRHPGRHAARQPVAA